MHYKIKPWAHQLAAIDLAKDRDNFALFMEQGCGKTSALINILRYKYAKQNRVMRTLILCPQIVIENWRREILAHSYIENHQIVCLTGAAWMRLNKFDNPPGNVIMITNYEALSRMQKLVEKLENWSPECVVLDESHKIKDLTSKRTKRAIALGKLAKHRYILSGTPILNSAFDVFSQFLFLDGGRSFSSDYRQFREKYFRDYNAHRPRHTYFPDWRVKPGALKAINEVVYRSAYRVTKDECLDLPPLVRQLAHFDMTGPQLTAYIEMERDLITYVKDRAVTAELAMTKVLRLLQITTGFVKDAEGVEHDFEDNPRREALTEVLQSIPISQKVIIWACFRRNYAEIRRVCLALGIDCVEITGDTPPQEKQANIDLFQSPQGPRALIGHPQSCGIGANLTAASYMVFYSRTHSLENDLQAEARNYRGGSEQHAKVTRIDLVANRSLDEVILSALAAKQDVSDTILNHFKR